MSMWDGMNDADAEGRIYFQEGSYLVAVERCKAIEASESFQGVPSFIVECTIIESSCAALPPGTEGVGWVQSIKSGKNQRALAQTSIKQFMAAILRDPNLGGNTPEQLAPHVTSEANPLRGLLVSLTCTTKKIKSTSGDFTKHQWQAPPEGTPTAPVF